MTRSSRGEETSSRSRSHQQPPPLGPAQEQQIRAAPETAAERGLLICLFQVCNPIGLRSRNFLLPILC